MGGGRQGIAEAIAGLQRHLRKPVEARKFWKSNGNGCSSRVIGSELVGGVCIVLQCTTVL